MQISKQVREELGRALDLSYYQEAETNMDYQENQRRAVADSPLGYQPERDLRGWLVVLAYAVAISVVCYMTKGGRL